MPTQRYKLTIAYRGTNYHGWQIQAANEFAPEGTAVGSELPTVQGLIRKALMSVVGHPLHLVGSSRTDARVHAKAQVAHFDTDQLQIPIEGLRLATNARLPSDIVIRSIEPVSREFDAIRSTISKRYQYVIWNQLDRPNFFPDLAWHRWQVLDVDAMIEAARRFEGTQDFASFARPGHMRENTIRTVHVCQVSRRGPQLVVGVEGNGFLWNMVRIMVGTLVEVGLGKYRPAEIDRMLAAKDRTAAGSTAPPEGLYLQWVKMQDASDPVRMDALRRSIENPNDETRMTNQ